MSEIAAARINSFALEPIDRGLAEKMSSLLHSLAGRVAILGEILQSDRQAAVLERSKTQILECQMRSQFDII